MNYSLDNKLKCAIEAEDIDKVKEILKDPRQHLITFADHYESSILKDNLDIFVEIMEHIQWKANLTLQFEATCKSGNFKVVKLLSKQLLKGKEIIDKQSFERVITKILIGKLYKHPQIATFLMDIEHKLRIHFLISKVDPIDSQCNIPNTQCHLQTESRRV